VRATILPAAMKVPLPRLLRLCSFGELQLEDWRIPKADCFSAVLSLDRGSLCFLEASLSNFLGATAGGGAGIPRDFCGTRSAVRASDGTCCRCSSQAARSAGSLAV
jgi:hypothetical protein